MRTEQINTLAQRFLAFVRQHWLATTIIVLVTIILAFALIRHHAHSAANWNGGGRNGQNGPIAVSVATATSGDIEVHIPALGAVTPLATVTIKTQISGQLQHIGFKEGQLVRQGDFIAQIDPRPYDAALKQTQANLQRDSALLANAEVDLKRYQGMLAENSIAEQQLATQQALVEQYKGTVEGDRAQVSSAALNLQYTHIVSPVSGRVGLRQVDQGNYVTPGDANGIVVVTQLQPISVIFSVPEDNITTIMSRLNQGATLTVTAFDKDNSTKLADGKLLTADNQIDPTTGTFKLRAMFDNKNGLLFANQFVNIQLLVNTLQNQTIIPNAAVRHGAPNGVTSAFVYLVNADDTVTVRTVELGTVDGDRVAVLKGLAAGDVVVTDGGDRLRDGAAILLPGKASVSAPTGAPTKKSHSWSHDGHNSNHSRSRSSASS